MRLRILVAEDEPFLLEITTLVLEDAGHEVLGAADGTRALRVAREEKPDVVLLDIMMPGLDGRDVARQLRSDPSLEGVRIVLYSSLSESQVDWREAGADAFRSKGESVRHLPKFVEDLVRMSPDGDG